MDCRTIMLTLVEQKSGSRSFLRGAPLAQVRITDPEYILPRLAGVLRLANRSENPKEALDSLRYWHAKFGYLVYVITFSQPHTQSLCCQFLPSSW
jgi:hypothetical protein